MVFAVKQVGKVQIKTFKCCKIRPRIAKFTVVLRVKIKIFFTFGHIIVPIVHHLFTIGTQNRKLFIKQGKILLCVQGNSHGIHNTFSHIFKTILTDLWENSGVYFGNFPGHKVSFSLLSQGFIQFTGTLLINGSNSLQCARKATVETR